MTTKFGTRAILILLLGSGLSLFGCGGDSATMTPDMGGMAGEGGDGGEGGMGGTAGAGAEAGSGGVGGEGGTGGTACECPRELTCDDAGACVERSPCEIDAHCTEGRICTDGECTDGCADDAACAAVDPLTPLCSAGRCVGCFDDDGCFGAGRCVDGLCEEPDTCGDSRECLGARICVGGACEDPVNCNDDGETCPNGQICTDVGECVVDPDASCEDDDDCSVIGHVCRADQRPPRCAPCQADEHCPNNQVCVVSAGGNRCAEPEACDNSNDCIGNRVCSDGQCTPPPCMEDMFEENDVVDDAVDVVAGLIRGLMSCGDDADWYAFELPEGNAATVSIRQADSEADLSLTLLNQDGAQLAQSITDQPTEAVVVGPYPSTQRIFVLVDQRAALAAGAYVMEVELAEAVGRCVDDAHESGVGDDTAETGRRVRAPGEIGFSGDRTGRLCPDDADFICFSTAAREQVTIDVNVLSGDLEVAGTAYRGNGDSFAESVWSRRGGEAISFRAGAGEYCLGLTAVSGSGSYDVDIIAVPTALISLCEEADELTLVNGRTTVQAQLPLDSEFSPICAGDAADGGEKIYTVTFDEADTLPVLLSAQVEGLAGGTLGDPVVSIRSVCGDGSTEVACSTGSLDPEEPQFFRASPAVARVPIHEPGTYAIAVDGARVGARPNFRLEVSSVPLSVPPANDTCETASELAFNPDGVTVVGLNLDQASNSVTTCVGRTGPDAVYRVTFLEPALVQMQVASTDGEFAVGAMLSADCRAEGALACGFGFDGRVEAGDYYLVIDGVDENSRGRVTLQMLVDSIDQGPANETCDAPTVLEPGGGDLSATTTGATDDYTLVEANLCTGHNSIGGDVVYSLTSEQGGRMFIQATPESGWDLSLYVVSDCGNPARNRIACSDGGLAESVVFDAQPGEEVFVIVDGSNGESGPFDLSWGSAECRIDVDCQSGSCVDFRCVD